MRLITDAIPGQFETVNTGISALNIQYSALHGSFDEHRQESAHRHDMTIARFNAVDAASAEALRRLESLGLLLSGFDERVNQLPTVEDVKELLAACATRDDLQNLEATLLTAQQTLKAELVGEFQTILKEALAPFAQALNVKIEGAPSVPANVASLVMSASWRNRGGKVIAFNGCQDLGGL